jgi:hypothetical protein
MGELSGCKKNCGSVCERASKLKQENPEVCVLRCHLACSNNVINKLLK